MSLPVKSEADGPEDFQWADACIPEDDVLPGHAGCRCAAGECQRGTCACATAVLTRDAQGLVTVLPTTEPAGLELTECGPLCACFGSCGLGFTAAAAAVPPISLRRSEGKGWGVFADEPLPAGLVVCHYAGEYVSNAEAQRRLAQYDEAGGGHALLVLREWLPSGTATVRLNIDATHRGNLARFFNHSCNNGNLELRLGRRTGCLLPRVVFCTRRPVAAAEELCWAYGPPNPGPQGRRCCCGTAACLGFMPHDDV